MDQVSQGRAGCVHAVVFIQGCLGHCFLRSFHHPRGSSPSLTVSSQAGLSLVLAPCSSHILLQDHSKQNSQQILCWVHTFLFFSGFIPWALFSVQPLAQRGGQLGHKPVAGVKTSQILHKIKALHLSLCAVLYYCRKVIPP